jgi:hypothetical protein
MTSQIEAYIEKQRSPQKEILLEVQKIFRETLPDSTEEMRWGVITYSSGKFYIAAMKNCVHVGFAITGLSNDEIAFFEGNGKTMRHRKIPTTNSIDKIQLAKLIRMVEQKATCEIC